MLPTPADERACDYEIWVEGQLGEQWSTWFGGLTITPEPDAGRGPLTRLSGPVVDQAQLRGILNTIWDLNLSVLSFNRAADPRPTREPTS